MERERYFFKSVTLTKVKAIIDSHPYEDELLGSLSNLSALKQLKKEFGKEVDIKIEYAYAVQRKYKIYIKDIVDNCEIVEESQ